MQMILRRSFLFPALALLAGAMALSSCSASGDDGVVDIAFIGEPDDPFEAGLRLSPAGQHIRAATVEGLVTLNANGEVVPALAERWIVTEDGLSYIFRLRNTEWSDGTPITGNSVRDALKGAREGLRGTSLGIDLAPIEETLAMTGRVIEVRLTSPMPDLLHLLAQPEMGILRRGAGSDNGGTGPMALSREGDVAVLNALPPERRGTPETEDWQENYRQIRVRGLNVEAALAAFAEGEVEVVLNGTLANLPLADTGPLSRGTVRLDAATGLFGLQVVRADGVMAEAPQREAIAMAIDRSDLMAPFNIGGWVSTTRILPTVAVGEPLAGEERWASISLEERQAIARRRILTWRAANDRQDSELVMLSIAMPAGPGSDLLLRELAADLEPIGVGLELAEDPASADLRLIDRAARFAGERWYLNQFNCSLGNGLCSDLADDRLAEAETAADPVAYADLLAEAEAALVETNAYIPLGAPVRWALVRGQIDGFAENPWALHPLFPFALRPI
ncbi:ABC transporter substrate-binding protein [Sphingomonadaceae bacterium]|nr:ABC transporter substrate-binding protein [Sphingomonadaceae bacterium]